MAALLQQLWGHMNKFEYKAVRQDDGDIKRADDDKGLPTSEKRSVGTRPNLYSSMFWLLLPSYVSNYYGHSSIQLPEPTDTSYLNGLRGLAAVSVFIEHATGTWYHYVEEAWGSGSGPEHHHLVQLPFLRLLVAGGFDVSIFFVLSGFVLSYSALKKIYANNSAGAIASLPAAVVRRPFRLFLPALPAMMLAAFFHTLGIYYMNLTKETWHPHGFFKEQYGAIKQWAQLSWQPLTWEVSRPLHAPQLWTLPDEFRGSMVIFMVTLACARLQPWLRMFIVTVFAIDTFIRFQHRSVALFLAGFVIAETRFFRTTLSTPSHLLQRAITLLSVCSLIFGLFLGSWGDGADHSPGFSIIYNNITTFGVHPQIFFQAFGAIMLLGALENLPSVQRLLNSQLCLYLGEISFSIYLVHWAFVYGPGKYTIHTMRDLGYTDYFSWIVGTTFEVIATFWLSDVCWRLIDKKSTKFARWVAEMVGA